MNHGKTLVTLIFSLLIAVSAHGSESPEGFDSEKMIEELEQKMELSREQWEKLKPVLDQKSKELKQSLHESVEKGYLEIEELAKKLDAMSEDAEMKVKEMLSSEEAQQIREYLSKVDEEAIREAKDQMVAELTALLELTEEQAAKIKPILDDSMAQLTMLLEDLAREGSKSWDAFREQFEKLSKDLQDKLQDTLDSRQMERLQDYNEEQKEKIQQVLFTA